MENLDGSAPAQQVSLQPAKFLTRPAYRFVAAIILIFCTIFMAAILIISWPKLSGYAWEINLWALATAGVIYSGGILLIVVAWNLIMRELGINIRYGDHLRIYCTTLIAGRIPGPPWHIAGRLVLYKELGVDGRLTGVASAIELILAVASGLFASLLIWFNLSSDTQAPLRWLILVPLLGLVLVHPSALHLLLVRLGYDQETIRFRYRDLLKPFGVYFSIWIVGGCVLYTLAITLFPLPLTQLPGIIGAWSLAGSLALLTFFIPTGLGIKEVVLSMLLALFMPIEQSVITAILARLFLTGIELLWAISFSPGLITNMS